MNRFDLQKMAEERVADARALLDAGRFQAAYYPAVTQSNTRSRLASPGRFVNSTFPIGRLSTTVTFTILQSSSSSPGCRNSTGRKSTATGLLRQIGRSWHN